jgi:hypothetical protein
MGDRTHGPVEITSLRVGRTDLGVASAVIDDEALILTVRVEGNERGLRLRFANVDTVHAVGNEVDLVVRDGTHVTITAPEDVRREIAGRCRSVPELTRTLRAFGSSRGRRVAPGGRTTDASEQQRFFAPFLDARRAAGGAAGTGAIEAFGRAALSEALAATLRQFATDRQPEPGPARRALEAELVDASEPLFDALAALRESAEAALASPEDLRLWRVWSAQLRMTFETADRVWIALDEALDNAFRHAATVAASQPKQKRGAPTGGSRRR